jgi:outer membrane protease
MRNILLFIFFVIVCCGFLTAPAQKAYSQTPADFQKKTRFGFSAYALTGIFYGQAEEIVYRNSRDPDYVSQLLWDIKPLAYAGTGLSFSINENRDALGFYTDASFKAGIPFRSGKMEDRDWKKADPSILTNYSAHENYTTRAFLADLALGISIPLKHKDRILAFLKLEGAVSYMYFDWIARNGYYQYDEAGGWDPSDASIPIEGDVCGYYQRWLTVSPGVALTIPIRSRWVIEASLNAAPGLIWVWAFDDHVYRKKFLPVTDPTEFQDYSTGGILVEGGLEVSYSFNAHLSLALRAYYRHIRNSRGDNRYRISDGETYSAWSYSYNTAGAGFHALDAGLTLKAFF